MEEIWKDIKGYEGLYQVSNLGRIKKQAQAITYIRNGKIIEYKIKEHIKNQQKTRYGYYHIILYKNNIGKHFQVHRLVAFAFLPLIDGKDFVNHKDGNKTNNCLYNLEWVNRSENMQHAFKLGLINDEQIKKKVECLTKAKYKKIEIFQNGKSIGIFGSIGMASKFLGVHYTYIRRIMNKKRKSKYIKRRRS